MPLCYCAWIKYILDATDEGIAAANAKTYTRTFFKHSFIISAVSAAACAPTSMLFQSELLGTFTAACLFAAVYNTGGK